MMAVSYETGIIQCVTTPPPPAQNSDVWEIFFGGLLPTMNEVVLGRLSPKVRPTL